MNAITDFTRETIEKRRSASYRDAKRYKGNVEVLLPEVAEEMTRRGPRAFVKEIPGCGHAPALMSADQIAIVASWLETGEVEETPLKSVAPVASAKGAAAIMYS